LFSAYETLIHPIVARLYHEHLLRYTDDFKSLTWLGRPMLQDPHDLQVIQETLFEQKPALLIETGTHQAGAALFYCSLFDLMGHGRLVSIDIEKLHDLSHPRARFLIGSSTSPEVLRQVAREVEQADGAVLVILDSDHSRDHVLAELRAYTPFVTPGSYCLTQDGVVDRLSFYRKVRPGPLRAIRQFLAENPAFAVDTDKCRRFPITHHPRGWLKRLP
jgi:cephalosporin hydroxylase